MNGLYLILALAAAPASADYVCFLSPTADIIEINEQCKSDCSVDIHVVRVGQEGSDPLWSCRTPPPMTSAHGYEWRRCNWVQGIKGIGLTGRGKPSEVG
jgi:hypothetical protein